MEHDQPNGSFLRWRDLTPRRIRDLVKLGNQLRRTYRHQLVEPGPPEDVILNDRSKQIQERAVELARDGASDDDAVRTLAELAGRHTLDLRVAAHSQQRHDRHREFAVHDRAYRLLQAVITGEPVSRPSTAEQAWLDTLANFRDKPLSEQFRMLTDIEPALGQVADDLAATAWTGHAPTSQQLVALTRLRLVVGPQASLADPLIRSGTAGNSAIRYLTEVARQRGENA